MQTRRVLRVGVYQWGWVKIFCVTCCFLFLASSQLRAQLPTGTILGVVKDQSGGVVVAAKVTVLNSETSLARTVVTGDDGSYRVPALPVGHYTVKAEKEGFKTQTQQGVELNVSDEIAVNATLEVGTSSQEVVVESEAPIVNTTTSSLGGLVNEDKISDLPLNGRNYLDLALLQPGITAIGNTTSSGTGGLTYSSNGAPASSNNYLIDGASMQNFNGTSASSVAGTSLGSDGIREYKVETNTFSAEYGLRMGSQMTLVSKGGSNRFSGDVFDYLRNSALDARDYFDKLDVNNVNGFGTDKSLVDPGKRLPPFVRNNFGAAFGGPIRHDKTFFFAVYEGLRERRGTTNVLSLIPAADLPVNPSNPNDPAYTSNPGCGGCVVAAASRPFLALYPRPNLPSNQFTYPYIQPTRVDFGQIRVDENFSQADSAFVRYTIDDDYRLAPSGLSQNLSLGRNQFLTISEGHVFTTSLLNTARVSFSRAKSFTNGVIPSSGVNLCAVQYQLIPAGFGGGCGPGTFTIPGVGAYYTVADPQGYTQNTYSLSDDVFWTRGRHALKFGTLINYLQVGQLNSLFTRGQVTFASLSAFLSGTSGLTQMNTVAPGSIGNRYYTFNTYGFYVQDDFRATSRLTLNLGFRYEFNTLPTEKNGRQSALRNIPTDTTMTIGQVVNSPSRKNFSPRIGFAWDVFGKGKTAVRGGFGINYDVMSVGGAFLNVALGQWPFSALFSETSTSSTPGPGFVPWGTPLPDWTNFNPATFTPTVRGPIYNLKTPYLLQYNLSVEQQLPGGIGLSVAYVGTRGLRLLQPRDENPVLPSSFMSNGLPFWGPNQPRLNTHFQYTYSITNGAESWYHALQVGVNKRLGHGLQFQSSYTFSKSEDTGGGQLLAESGPGSTIFPMYPPNPRLLDKGLSGFDVRHNWRFNVLYNIPNLRSDHFAAKLIHGWWLADIVSVSTGQPINLFETNSRSRSFQFNLQTAIDRPDIVTSANLAQAKLGNANAIVYDPATVITGLTNQWYNKNMFTVQPVGTLGDTPRNFITAPGVSEMDFSVAKDTRVKYLGERGNVQFKLDVFNILNHPNLGTPANTVFSGSVSDLGVPLGNAGQITASRTTSRQMQLSLKLMF